MRDASVMLLILILLNMLLDHLYSRWRERGHRQLVTATVLMGIAQGVAVGGVMYGFDRRLLAAICAAMGFALCWTLIRGLVGKWKSGFAFVLQAALQVVALTAIWLSAEGYWGWAGELGKGLFSAHNLLVLLAYVLVLRPASALIGAVLTPFVEGVKESSRDSLKKAGTWIGYLERMLILTFVLLEQWEAIGFLLTAKSILRFNDIKGAEQRPLSEYVLLGTLVSFTVSIAVGLAVLKLSGK